MNGCVAHATQRLKMKCKHCHQRVPHFKALIEHLKSEHPEVAKRFEIKNKTLKQVLIMEGESAEQICKEFNWNIKDCSVKTYEE